MAKVIVQKDDAVLKKLVPKFPNTDAEVIKSVLAWTKKKIGKGEERAKFEERLEKAKALPEGKERVSKINGGEIALAAFDLLTVEEKKEAPVESLPQEPMQAHVEERALDVKVKSEEELTKEADDLLLRNELAKALELYDQLISRNPMNDHALHYKGKTLMELGRLDEALNAVELSLGLRSEEAAKATKRDITMRLALREEAEKDAKIRCKQAKDWLDLEIYDSALEESESALRKSPAYLPAWLCKGQALEGLGRHREALEAYSEVLLKLDPNNEDAKSGKERTQAAAAKPEALLAEADRVSKGGNFGQAAYLYDEALKVPLPSGLRVSLLVGKGDALRHLGKDSEAVQAFSEALNFDPKNDAALGFMCDSLNRQKSFDKMLAACEERLKADPDNLTAQTWRDVAQDNINKLKESGGHVLLADAEFLGDAREFKPPAEAVKKDPEAERKRLADFASELTEQLEERQMMTDGRKRTEVKSIADALASVKALNKELKKADETLLAEIESEMNGIAAKFSIKKAQPARLKIPAEEAVLSEPVPIGELPPEVMELAKQMENELTQDLDSLSHQADVLLTVINVCTHPLSSYEKYMDAKWLAGLRDEINEMKGKPLKDGGEDASDVTARGKRLIEIAAELAPKMADAFGLHLSDATHERRILVKDLKEVLAGLTPPMKNFAEIRNMLPIENFEDFEKFRARIDEIDSGLIDRERDKPEPIAPPPKAAAQKLAELPHVPKTEPPPRTPKQAPQKTVEVRPKIKEEPAKKLQKPAAQKVLKSTAPVVKAEQPKAATPKKKTAAELFEEAEKLFVDGNFKVAFASFSAAAKLARAEKAAEVQSKALVGQGASLVQLGKPKDALPLLEDALELDPKSIVARVWKIDAFMDLKSYNDALKACTEILTLDGNNINAMLRRAWIYEDMGKREDANKWFDKALEIGPKNREALAGKERVAALLAKEAPARQAAAAPAVEITPKIINGIVTDAEMLEETKRVAEIEYEKLAAASGKRLLKAVVIKGIPQCVLIEPIGRYSATNGPALSQKTHSDIRTAVGQLVKAAEPIIADFNETKLTANENKTADDLNLLEWVLLTKYAGARSGDKWPSTDKATIHGMVIAAMKDFGYTFTEGAQRHDALVRVSALLDKLETEVGQLEWPLKSLDTADARAAEVAKFCADSREKIRHVRSQDLSSQPLTKLMTITHELGLLSGAAISLSEKIGAALEDKRKQLAAKREEIARQVASGDLTPKERDMVAEIKDIEREEAKAQEAAPGPTVMTTEDMRRIWDESKADITKPDEIRPKVEKAKPDDLLSGLTTAVREQIAKGPSPGIPLRGATSPPGQMPQRVVTKQLIKKPNDIGTMMESRRKELTEMYALILNGNSKSPGMDRMETKYAELDMNLKQFEERTGGELSAEEKEQLRTALGDEFIYEGMCGEIKRAKAELLQVIGLEKKLMLNGLHARKGMIDELAILRSDTSVTEDAVHKADLAIVDAAYKKIEAAINEAESDASEPGTSGYRKMADRLQELSKKLEGDEVLTTALQSLQNAKRAIEESQQPL